MGPSSTSTCSPLAHHGENSRQSDGDIQGKYSGAASNFAAEYSATVSHCGSTDSGYALCVRVRNSKFPGYIGDSDLKSHFSDFHSHIVDTFVHRSPQTGESSGYGFVIFDTHFAAKTALRQLQGSKLHDKFSLYI